MNGYILLCQILTSPILFKNGIQTFHHNKHDIGIAGGLYISILSIWNLDFFKLFYTPFCLHSNASTLQVLSLDYITAVYPLILIIITYTLVRLHYNNCRLVVWLWKPFISCFARCRRQWDIQNSLVDAFATFLLLSYVKFFSVSFDLLTPTLLWDNQGKIQRITLYYDGTADYFGVVHVPYAILAITVLIIFTILPILLLCLYPCRCFQRLLNRLHWHSHSLHHFMDTFQGSFKDGTNENMDCRFFAAVYLIIRLILHFGFLFTMSSFSMLQLIQALLLLCTIALLFYFQPYKEQSHNRLDALFIFILCAILNIFWEFYNDNVIVMMNVYRLIFLTFALIPIIYPLCLVLLYVLRLARNNRAMCDSHRKIITYLRCWGRRQHVTLCENTALLVNEL